MGSHDFCRSQGNTVSREFKHRRPATRGLCCVPGCDRPAVIKTTSGLCCNKHYQRFIHYASFDAPPKKKPSRYVVCAQCNKEFDRGYSVNAKRSAKPQYCSLECWRFVKSSHARAAMPDRFWANVAMAGFDECWEWKGRSGHYGYGAFDWGGRPHIASRLAYELTTGKDPGSLFVCHTCDNPPCCNPRHLWLGTHRDNMRDAAKKGRMKGGGLMGEAHGCAKLSEADVLAIRKSAARNCDLAAHYGITPEAISSIRRRVTWRHV